MTFPVRLGEVEELAVRVERRVLRNRVRELADKPVELEGVAVVQAEGLSM